MQAIGYPTTSSRCFCLQVCGNVNGSGGYNSCINGALPCNSPPPPPGCGAVRRDDCIASSCGVASVRRRPSQRWCGVTVHLLPAVVPLGCSVCAG